MKRSFLLTVTFCISCGSGSDISLKKEENEIVSSTYVNTRESGNYVDEAFFDEMTFD